MQAVTANEKQAANNTQSTDAEREADNSDSEDPTKKKKSTWVQTITAMISEQLDNWINNIYRKVHPWANDGAIVRVYRIVDKEAEIDINKLTEPPPTFQETTPKKYACPKNTNFRTTRKPKYVKIRSNTEEEESGII